MSVFDEFGENFVKKMCNLFVEDGWEEIETENFFQKPTETELDTLRRLVGDNVDKVMEFYKEYQPYELPMLPCYLNLRSIKVLVEENKNFAPGAYVSQHGVIVFGTTVGGDAVCIDTNRAVDGDPAVVMVDHTFCYEDGETGKICVSHVPQRVMEQLDPKEPLPFNYKTIALCASRINDSFVDFIKKLSEGYYEDMEEFLED